MLSLHLLQLEALTTAVEWPFLEKLVGGGESRHGEVGPAVLGDCAKAAGPLQARHAYCLGTSMIDKSITEALPACQSMIVDCQCQPWLSSRVPPNLFGAKAGVIGVHLVLLASVVCQTAKQHDSIKM